VLCVCVVCSEYKKSARFGRQRESAAREVLFPNGANSVCGLSAYVAMWVCAWFVRYVARDVVSYETMRLLPNVTKSKL